MGGARKGGVGPEGSCAGETALDLVVDEYSANFVAAVSEGLEEGGGGNVYAAFALNGFDEDAAG